MLEELTRLYDAYVDTYREADGELPVMMRLKRVHTGFVVKNAEAIADGENFTAEEREVSLAAALLHDTGRYEQLKRYNTFKDSDSIDHAVFSHDIVKEKGWLDKVEVKGLGLQWKDAILKAVLYHNRRDLPPEIEQSNNPNNRTILGAASHTVRDADKLDIFRVLRIRSSIRTGRVIRGRSGTLRSRRRRIRSWSSALRRGGPSTTRTSSRFRTSCSSRSDG